jgi:hypothetical protein
MQAYKLTGKIDRSGKLTIDEPIDLNPGQVEVIILQTTTTTERESLENKARLFWQGESIANLIDTQKPTIVEDLENLVGDFWGDDSIEDFLAFLKQQRQM